MISSGFDRDGGTRGYTVAVEGISALDDLERMTPEIEKSVRMALSSATRYARSQSSKEIRDEIRFPASYLNSGRLRSNGVRRIGGVHEGSIVARGRATSLARFGVSNLAGRPGTGPASFKVKTYGSTKTIRRAFLIPLRSGNVGIAYRLKPGQLHAPGKRSSASVFTHTKRDGRREDLDILYGPSVDQVFRSVSEKVAPDALREVEREFLRLMGVVM